MMVQQWEIKDELTVVTEENGLSIITIDNPLAHARIALQGGHMLSYQAHGQQPLLWLSPDAVFQKGKSIRGGVPICWPWFGAHPSDSALPAHGFARNQAWELVHSQSLDNGGTHMILRLLASSWTTRFPLTLELSITVGKQLRMELRSKNIGHEIYRISQALHSYFLVGDVQQTQVIGLDGCTYYDKLQDFATQQQDGNVSIPHEVDRVYINTPKSLRIMDASLQRSILIETWGSASTVVWNPWHETAKTMGDMGETGYQQMLCVETANAFDDTVALHPDAEHVMGVAYTSCHDAD